MKNKNVVYYTINLIFLALTILFIKYNDIINMQFTPFQILVLIFICVCIHFIKFIRIYFILLEEKIPFKRMLKIYIKTAFVSIVFPFKFGELFKIYSYGEEINNYPKGIISVVVDKLFDAIVLCAILIPYELINVGRLSILAIVMLIFIITILAISMAFEGTYYYLNKFFIINGKSKKSIYALSLIEKFKNVYKNAKDMLRGRILILLGLTIISWLMEAGFLYVISNFININIQLGDVVNYINDAFLGGNNVLFDKYVYICAVLFLAIIVLMYTRKIIAGGKKIWKK